MTVPANIQIFAATRPRQPKTVADGRRLLLKSVSESEWERSVVGLAKAHGWLCYHARPARMADGSWRTPVTSQGFPDWLFVRDGRMLAVELKSEQGKPSKAQEEWLEALGMVPGVEAHVWRPSDQELALRVLGEAA